MRKSTKFSQIFFRENNQRGIDFPLLSAVLILLAIGIMMVYSASIAYAARDNSLNSQYYYLIPSLIMQLLDRYMI